MAFQGLFKKKGQIDKKPFFLMGSGGVGEGWRASFPYPTLPNPPAPEGLTNKKVTAMSYASSISSSKPWRRYLRWRICTSVATGTHSQNSVAAAEARNLKIFSHGTSPFKFDWKSLEIETTTWSEFLNAEKAILEQILASEEMHKPKRTRLWESQPGIRAGKLTIWVKVIWD